MVTQKELDEMSENINKSMKKIYKENFPDEKSPQYKIVKGKKVTFYVKSRGSKQRKKVSFLARKWKEWS